MIVVSEEHKEVEGQQKIAGLGVGNIGEPLRFSDVEEFAGFSAEPGKGGEKIKVWTRMALTSDEPLFHRLVESLAGVVSHMAQQAHTHVNLRRVDTMLLVLKQNTIAELWLDTAAVSIQCAVKRPIKAGTVVFEHDIADVTGMAFPCVDIGTEDKLLCLFRQDWRFGLAFDMNPDGKLDLEGFNKMLGALYREMRYKHLYEALGETETFDHLLAAGWFPFVEIIGGEFKEILNHCEARFDMAEIEEKTIAKFDEERMERILDRWLAKPHFAEKSQLMRAAIAAFNKREPIATIKILLTEIEGVLNDAHKAAKDGQGAKIKKLLEFAEASAESKAGGSNTLLFPKAFSRYLREHTFADFNPTTQTGTASSRHAVGHGAASEGSYTLARALQTILTLDQLAFYT
jgi:hypothetical protein